MSPPTYTSTVTFAVTARNTASTALGNVTLRNTVVARIGELLSSDVVRAAAAQELELDSFPATVDVSVPEDTNIVILNVTADTPELAWRSARAIVRCHAQYSGSAFSNALLESINGPTIPTTADNGGTRSTFLRLAAPLGGAAVIALLVLLYLLADTVQTPDGAKRQVDGKLLATLHHEKKRRGARDRLRGRKRSLLITDPTCTFYYTETIHQLRVLVERAHEKKKTQIFLLTSCTENEGKSTLAANLALSLAQKHHRVLLLDADLRKPAQSLIFEHRVERGCDVASFLQTRPTEKALDAAISFDEATGLHTLYAMSVSRRRTESLSADAFRPLLEMLRSRFSYIIIDTPPMGLFADAQVLADAADATMLVVRQDVVPAIVINDTIDALSESSAEFMGFVLNDVRSVQGLRLPGMGYGYGYGYGYGGKKRAVSHQSSAGKEDSLHG